LPQPRDWGSWSVEAQDGASGSTLELYREAIRLRKKHLTSTEAFEWAELADDLLVFDRGEVRVIVNFGDNPGPLPPGDVLLVSSVANDGLLPADTAAWVRGEGGST
jgi:alpha-glucosidase